MNTQLPEKRVPLSASSDKLSVHSIFPTIQGEGPYAGRRAVFVRLAGCNLQCPRCDTEYTIGRLDWNIRSILSYVREAYPGGDPRCGLVVITGGEPFRQNILPLVELLVANSFQVQIETNGTLSPGNENTARWCCLAEDGYLTVVCSPKAGKVHSNIIELLNADGLQYNCYKYVLDADHIGWDGLPTLALEHPASPCLARPHGPGCTVYVQPMDAGDPVENKRHMDAAVASCLKHGYTLCIQTHKVAGVE